MEKETYKLLEDLKKFCEIQGNRAHTCFSIGVERLHYFPEYEKVLNCRGISKHSKREIWESAFFLGLMFGFETIKAICAHELKEDPYIPVEEDEDE